MITSQKDGNNWTKSLQTNQRIDIKWQYTSCSGIDIYDDSKQRCLVLEDDWIQQLTSNEGIGINPSRSSTTFTLIFTKWQ